MNVGTVNLMVSENPQVGRTHKGESSEAGTRGGLVSSTDEGSVMGLDGKGPARSCSSISTEKKG
jgi:hypothetical protein